MAGWDAMIGGRLGLRVCARTHSHFRPLSVLNRTAIPPARISLFSSSSLAQPQPCPVSLPRRADLRNSIRVRVRRVHCPCGRGAVARTRCTPHNMDGSEAIDITVFTAHPASARISHLETHLHTHRSQLSTEVLEDIRDRHDVESTTTS